MDFLKTEFKNIGLVHGYDQNSSERYTLENKSPSFTCQYCILHR